MHTRPATQSKVWPYGFTPALSLVNRSLKLDFAFGKPGAARRSVLDVRGGEHVAELLGEPQASTLPIFAWSHTLRGCT